MTWIVANLSLLVELTLTHARLALIPIVLGVLIAVPLGRLAHKLRLGRGVLLAIIGVLYTIPSLALFTLPPLLFGVSVLSEANIVIALTIYAVALLTRTAADAFQALDEDVLRSAVAMGYGPLRRFWAVELPLAGPVLLAGLRVAAVSTVSLVTVGVLVGSRSLGFLFMDGLQRGIIEEIAAGIVLTVAVALILDGLLLLLGRVLMPWAATPRQAERRARRAASAPSSAPPATERTGAAA